MKHLLKISAASAVLALGMSGASADLLLHSDPTSDEKRVINTETQSEAPVLMSTDGQRPSDCPEGTFFLFEDPADNKQVVTDCVAGTRFLAAEPGEGTQLPEGAPEGAFLLTEDSSDNKAVIEKGIPERSAAPMQSETGEPKR